jgi:phosphoserine phosphatase
VSSITPSLHFQISGSTFSEVRSTLSLLAREKNYEIALQNPEFLHARKMVVLDVDSTLIEQEVIELLARKAGVEDSVKEITDRAMKGELDFTQSLIARVALLKGLPEKTLSDVRAEITFTPGARDLIKTLQRLGHAVGLVTGGFIEVLEPLIEDLGIVYVKANGLEMEDGLLTGLTRGTIIDREGKASALKEFSESESIPMQHTIAIGDGANDIDMVSAAGLGIAFRAKPILCAHADTLIFQNDLGRVIDLLGIPRLN